MKKLLLVFLLAPLFFSDLNAQALLYGQTDSVGTSGILCRKHDNVASAGYDTEGADDFTVPSGETWYLDSLKVYGFYSSSSPTPTSTPAIINIYSDNSGLPGSVFFTDTLAEVDVDKDGNLEPSWNTPITLTSGTYWLSVRTYSSSAAWYWRRITPQISPYVFQWQNTGGSYSVCTTWEPLSTCLSINDSSVAFRMYGCYGPTKPNLTDLGPDTTHCGPGTISLVTGSSQSGIAYLWNTGATTNSINVDSAGYYRVIVYDTATLCGLYTDINVTFADEPDAMLTDKQGCPGSGTSFLPTACPTCQYVWQDGSTNFYFQTNSPQTVYVTVTDTTTGCSSVDTAQFSLYPFELTFVPGDSAYLCDGQDLVVSTVEDFVSYAWSVNGVPSNADSVIVTSNGNVILQVVDTNNCHVTDTVVILEGVPAVPIIQQGFSGGNITLATNQSYSTYLWSTGDTTETITLSQSGTYSLTVTNEYGCEGTAIKIVSSIAFGIEDNDLAQLKLYPNPATDVLNINWPEGWVGNASGDILDQTGRLVKVFDASNPTQQLNVSDLAKGIYLINLKHEEGTVQYNLIVQ